MTHGRVGKAATVLVVEDDAALRLLCTVNLELEGHRVLEAPTLPTARELLERENVDVVLLDVHVGRESGYELIDAIRRGGAALVLMSGTAEVGESDRRRVDAVLSKPFDPEDLTGLVARFSDAGSNS